MFQLPHRNLAAWFPKTHRQALLLCRHQASAADVWQQQKTNHPTGDATPASQPRTNQAPSNTRSSQACLSLKTFGVMRRRTTEKAANTAVGKFPRAMTMVVMVMSVGNGRAFQAYGLTRSWARTRQLSLGAALAERALGKQEHAQVQHAVEDRLERDEAGSMSFFERIGRPRYIAAPMVEHSEAGE